MAGTRAGGKLAAQTNKARHGEDFYAIQGAKGGKLGKTGGFYYSKVHGLNTHKEAGRLGGLKSKPYSIHPRPIK